MADDNSSLDIKTPIGSITANGLKRTSEIIAIFSLCVMVGMGVVLYSHAEDQKKAATEQKQSTEAIKDAIKEQTQATKLQTCVIYLTLPDEKKRQIGFDERVNICR